MAFFWSADPKGQVGRRLQQGPSMLRGPAATLFFVLLAAYVLFCFAYPLKTYNLFPDQLRAVDEPVDEKALYVESGSASLGGVYYYSRQKRPVRFVWNESERAYFIRRDENQFLLCARGSAAFLPEMDFGKFHRFRSAALWQIDHVGKDVVTIRTKGGQQMYLSVRNSVLYCDGLTSEGAAWSVRRQKSTESGAPQPWEGQHVSREDAALDDTVVLFGTLKPLRKLEPNNASDMFDDFIITRRTLLNWASLPGVRPVVFADDAMNHELIRQINAANDGKPGTSRIDVVDRFEFPIKYRTPTYRGLFAEAIRRYPTAKAIMYSNGDILYTDDLAKTVREVRRAYEAKKRTVASLRGWYVVGQRINVNVPPASLMDSPASADALREMSKKGEYFPTFGEDYFIMNPELFDWGHMPPYLVGGVVFDNWLTSQGVLANLRGEAMAVDATKTLTAVHQNHGIDVFACRLKPKSRFNQDLFHKTGRAPYRLTTHCPYATELRDGRIVIFKRLH